MRNDPDIHNELLRENPFGEYSQSNLLDLAELMEFIISIKMGLIILHGRL